MATNLDAGSSWTNNAYREGQAAYFTRGARTASKHAIADMTTRLSAETGPVASAADARESAGRVLADGRGNPIVAREFLYHDDVAAPSSRTVRATAQARQST